MAKKRATKKKAATPQVRDLAGLKATTMTVAYLRRRKAEYNPRTISDHDRAALEQSLETFGVVQTVVFNKRTKRVVGGHQTIEAAHAKGWPELPVAVVDLPEIEEKALNLALNKISGEWVMEDLASMLGELQAAGEEPYDLSGFTIDEYASITELGNASGPEPAIVEDTPPPPPKVATARLGDLWALGDHTLLCGDSTNEQHVKRAMGKDRAALVSTDPPYLVDYTGSRPGGSGKDWSDSYREIEIKDAEGFFRAVFTNVLVVLKSHAAIYCWHAHKRCGMIQSVWADLGILDHQQIIWVKPTSVFGRVYWHFKHEPCMMGWKQGNKPEHDGTHDFNSVWELGWGDKARIVGNEHPTQKPVEIFARPMRKHTKKGDVCFEPFSGSGSQIVAAEQMGRRCRAIEISPPFVDVAILRWQELTGRAAILASSGKTFAQVRTARKRRAAPKKATKTPGKKVSRKKREQGAD